MHKIILIGLFVLLMPIALANLDIQPVTMDINTKIQTHQDHALQMTNNFNFTIYNITFSPVEGFFFPTITELQKNTSISTNFSTYFNTPLAETFPSTVSFLYLVDIDPILKTHRINITDDGYQPNTITIKQQDFINWTNLGSINHTVTTITGLPNINENLAPNQSFTQQFNTIGLMEYKDNFLLFGGEVITINRSEKDSTHNPSYDKIINFNVNSVYEESSVDLSLVTSSFNVSFMQSTEGLLSVHNNGSEPVIDVQLSSSQPSWIVFHENNFNLTVDETNFVAFTVTANVNSTNQTNKTHQVEVIADATNIIRTDKNISIFIPYKLISNLTFIDPAEYYKYRTEFCTLFPNSTDCNMQPIIVYQNRTVYKPLDTQFNLTGDELEELFTRQEDSEKQRILMDNFLKEEIDKMNNRMNTIEDDTNSTYSLFKGIYDQAQSEKNLGWALATLAVIIVCANLIVYFVMQKKKQKQQDSQFQTSGVKYG